MSQDGGDYEPSPERSPPTVRSETPLGDQDMTSSPSIEIPDSDDSMEVNDNMIVEGPPRGRIAVAVRVSPVRNRDEFVYYEPKDEVETVLRKYQDSGIAVYSIRLLGGEIIDVTYNQLQSTKGGVQAWQKYEQSSGEKPVYRLPKPEVEKAEMKLRRRPEAHKKQDYVDISAIGISSSEDDIQASTSSFRNPVNARASRARSGRRGPVEPESSDDDVVGSRRKRMLRAFQLPVRRSSRAQTAISYNGNGSDEDASGDGDLESSDIDILRSDVRKKGRGRGRPKRKSKPEKVPQAGTRQSHRSTRTLNNMQEADIDDIYRSASEPREAKGPRPSGMREVFEPLPRKNAFRMRHREICEVCFGGSNAAPLIYCQGCSLSYHQDCLGQRNVREHLDTKIGDDSFVLQCKRCVNSYQKRDPTAPDLSKCQDCGVQGPACHPFRSRKTVLQEQKERDENDGEDPIVNVPGYLINNEQNVLFRCIKCSRAWHYHHLPSLSFDSMDVSGEDEEIAETRFQEYSQKWICEDCDDMGDKKMSALVAWRPKNANTYKPGRMVNDDDKEYLIKWENQSYFRVTWCAGAWVWGVSHVLMRKAFLKRDLGPKMQTEDAIPEEYIRADIVLDVTFKKSSNPKDEEADRARIKDVEQALIKYKGLSYEDAVWEEPPSPKDEERYQDFVSAYNDWVAGRYIEHTKTTRARLDEIRNTPFAQLELEKQPEGLVGGELMKYQLEGVNWMYYQWYSQKNGILADEMGLGKTIQVIGFIATLIEKYNLFPFLVVVPNATVANWRREIKHWAPSMRVVTYFGSAESRKLAYNYEMYPGGSTELQCHVVVTSYEAATDDSCKRVFRKVKWTGLIVDEGQKLKNDKSLIHGALDAIKVPYRLLLTGTPLQNNIRELFNLLQFLDNTINASELEEKYQEMTSELIKELHDQIRPFILRRTKAQVLTFLPPLGQVIVPLSMSHLQKSVYKSILSKSPELLKALFSSEKRLKAQDRAKLSNILMQLRKCLCHPFVYSRGIEERTDDPSMSHRNLVEASSRLVFLEHLLPKLRERGHRVLMFSQFLDNLNIIEDFLDGMHLPFQRLDGSMGSLEKQKRIDQFNAPNSPLFAFLLSTRAGGVGINLATADTVIILDPDYNPHQDIQAISRAHRIGQKKKVLCFQLMVRASVEEKIIQMGRKKMALDHVVVEKLDAEEFEDQDLESVIKHGTAELFNDKPDVEIRYDDASIDKLLDRSELESTKTDDENSAESQFSFARVWANDSGSLEDNLNTTKGDAAPDPGVWDKILKERRAAAEAEEKARLAALGRGKRARGVIDYTVAQAAADGIAGDVSPSPKKRRTKRKGSDDSDDDDDFEARPESPIPEDFEVDDPSQIGSDERESLMKAYTVNGLGRSRMHPKGKFSGVTVSSGPKGAVAKEPHSYTKPFKRARLPTASSQAKPGPNQTSRVCPACRELHPEGACPLKAAGVEHCPLCGLAHYGYVLNCPHLRSETQVTLMLEALESSPEAPELVQAARKYLQGAKHFLQQQKKKISEKKATEGGQPNTTNRAAPLPVNSPRLPVAPAQKPVQSVQQTKPPMLPTAASQSSPQPGPLQSPAVPPAPLQRSPQPGPPKIPAAPSASSQRQPVASNIAAQRTAQPTQPKVPPKEPAQKPTPPAHLRNPPAPPARQSQQSYQHQHGGVSTAQPAPTQRKNPAAVTSAPSSMAQQLTYSSPYMSSYSAGPVTHSSTHQRNHSGSPAVTSAESPYPSYQSPYQMHYSEATTLPSIRATQSTRHGGYSAVPPVSSASQYYPSGYQPAQQYTPYNSAENSNGQGMMNDQCRSNTMDQHNPTAAGYYTSSYPAPDSVGSYLQHGTRGYPDYPTYPRQQGHR